MSQDMPMHHRIHRSARHVCALDLGVAPVVEQGLTGVRPTGRRVRREVVPDRVWFGARAAPMWLTRPGDHPRSSGSGGDR